MLKTYFKTELDIEGHTTCLTHGRTSVLYEKPTIVELGNILSFTEGLLGNDDDLPPWCGHNEYPNNDDDNNDENNDG